MLPIRTHFGSSGSHGGDGGDAPRRKTEGHEKKEDNSPKPPRRMTKSDVDEFMNRRMAELASGLPPVSGGGGSSHVDGGKSVVGGDGIAEADGDGTKVAVGPESGISESDRIDPRVAAGTGAGTTTAGRAGFDSDAFLSRRMAGLNSNLPNVSVGRGTLHQDREFMRMERARAAEKRAAEGEAKRNKESSGADGASDADWSDA